MNILITGINGFIGTKLAEVLSLNSAYNVSGTTRKKNTHIANCKIVQVGDLSSDTNWKIALKGVDVVIHTAARAHVLNEFANDPLSEFRKANVEGTLNLAQQGIANGVKRFIFLSSIGVNGSETYNMPFTETMTEEPAALYAISKFEAETKLKKMAKNSNLELVIIRPPLVYGPNAPGNLAKLIKLVKTSIPLPFYGMKNKRSLISIDNVVNFIELCIHHPRAKNETFAISDDHSISTQELISYIAMGLEKKSYFFPVPDFIVKRLATLIGRQSMYTQLFGNLEIDCTKAKTTLGWIPNKNTQFQLVASVRNSDQT